MFRPTTIVLPIAVMSFAIVSFLLMIDLSIYPPGQETAQSSTKNTATVNNNTNVPAAKTCQPTGCSGQICSDQDVVSTCEFRAEYECYQNAVCERQSDGECGWTETEEFTGCVQAARGGYLEPDSGPSGD